MGEGGVEGTVFRRDDPRFPFVRTHVDLEWKAFRNQKVGTQSTI